MSIDKYVEANLSWIKSGKIGCTFASYFARMPEAVGWKFQISPETLMYDNETLLLSMIFPEKTKESVKQWALSNGFYLEYLGDNCKGLRLDCPEGVSWVQYFGPDADVVTRQCPYPMLMMCVKLPAKYYTKAVFKGVLHIAHTCISGLSDFVANRLWETSHSNTERQLGHKPTLKEASKTTYHE